MFKAMANAKRRVWPHWAATVATMLRHGAVVRVGCGKCRTVFDVDLHAIVKSRGADYSLIDARSQCKVTSCRGTGYFLAAGSMSEPLLTMLNAEIDPCGIDGKRPVDIEPPDTPPEPARAARAGHA